jgi:Tfp pilus assembly protein PilF
MKRDADADERFGKFRAAIEKEIKANPKDADNDLSLAMVSLRLGQPARADVLMQKALAMDPSQHFGFATYLSVQGKSDAAIDQLELAIQKGFRNYLWLTIHVDLDTLRSEPRFQALMGRLIKK